MTYHRKHTDHRVSVVHYAASGPSWMISRGCWRFQSPGSKLWKRQNKNPTRSLTSSHTRLEDAHQALCPAPPVLTPFSKERHHCRSTFKHWNIKKHWKQTVFFFCFVVFIRCVDLFLYPPIPWLKRSLCHKHQEIKKNPGCSTTTEISSMRAERSLITSLSKQK